MNAFWDVVASIGLSQTVVQFLLVNAILGLSIYITLYTGMFSLANAGFMAIGAYTGVILTQHFNLPLGIALIGAMLLAGIMAAPLGVPVLRLRDLYLAIATIGFGEIIRIILLNFDEVASKIAGHQVELTGGALGLKGIPKITETWQLILFLVILGYFFTRLHRSRFGRAMAAIRQDETVAASMGINTVYVKSVVFILSAMIAAAGGVFSAHLTRIISPTSYGFDRVVDILAFAVLGGTNSWAGAIVGAGVLTAVPEIARPLKQYNEIVSGIILLVVIIFLPGGIVNPQLWKSLRQRLVSRVQPLEPSK
jgi:branched-chain amino acid transport system permease protein